MKKVKVNKNGVKKIIAAVAVLLAVAVLCYEISNFNSSNVKTQPAAATTYRNSITVKMFAVRDESLINGSSSLTYVPLLQDGERVAGGQAIAAQFGKADSASAYVDLESRKSELARYESLNSQQNLNELDISKINLQADSYFYEMLDGVRSGKISGLESSAEKFSDKTTAKQILINGNIDFSKKIASLKSEIASLTAKVGSVDYLKADDTGYYVSSADGYENTLSFSNIKNLSSDKIKAALSASPAAVPANTKGKLIHGYTWYFVGIVNKSDATRLNDGDSVTLRCDNMSRDSINASVYYRGPINTDETVLILYSDIARLRTEDVEIVINETDGIRVNKSAVRVINGVQGVYVLTGNIVRFKKLDIIYTGEDYVISKMIKEDVYDENKVPYLKIYDAVILEGKDLKDGKLIGY